MILNYSYKTHTCALKIKDENKEQKISLGILSWGMRENKWESALCLG